MSLIVRARSDYQRRRPPLAHPSSVGISSPPPGRTFPGGRFLSSPFCRRPAILLITGKRTMHVHNQEHVVLNPRPFGAATSPRTKGVSATQAGIDFSGLLSLSQAVVQACFG